MSDDIQRELGEVTTELRNIKEVLDEIKDAISTDREDIRELMRFRDLAYGCAKLIAVVLVALPAIALFK